MFFGPPFPNGNNCPSGRTEIHESCTLVWTKAGEVGVEYLDDDIEKVFHADNATPQYKDLFERASR